MIEVPKGSRNKYEFDHHNGYMKLDRMLFSAVHYPSDYGFFLDTLAEDGDPLDALVLLWESTFPGCVIEVKPIAVFKMVDEKGPDAKILCVPKYDSNWNHLKKLSDIPPHLLKEIAHFFSIYKDLEKKKISIEGWADLDVALKIIEDSKQRFKKTKSHS